MVSSLCNVRNISLTIATSGTGVAAVGAGLNFYYGNTSIGIINAVAALFPLSFIGISLKYIPIGTLEKVVTKLSTLPAELSAILNKPVQEAVKELGEFDLSMQPDLQQFKSLVLDLNRQIAQLKSVLAQFAPLIEQIGKTNTGMAATAQKISSLFSVDVEKQTFETLPALIKDAQSALVESQQAEKGATEVEIDKLQKLIKRNEELLKEIAEARSLMNREKEELVKMRGS